MDFVDNNIQKVQMQPKDQVYARNEDIKVYGKLVSMSTENVVADSEQIWDNVLKKNQSDINSVIQSKFGEYLRLDGGRIDGDLGVIGRVDLGGPLTVALGISAGMVTVDDGKNSANFTPTSIELGLGDSNDETHVTAKTINTNKVFLTQKVAQGTVTVDTSITPNLIRLHQTPGRVTTIQPSGIISPMFQLVGGTDNQVLLGDGSTTSKVISQISTNTQPDAYIVNVLNIDGAHNSFTILGATERLAGLMTAVDKTKLDDVPKIYAEKSKTISNIAVGNRPNKRGLYIAIDYADRTNPGTIVNIPNVTTTSDGCMSYEDKNRLDNIKYTYLPLSGGTLTGTLRLNDLNSDENGLDINNVNGIQSVDQDKVLTPEVWTTNGNSIPLNIANGIAKLDQNGNIPLENLGNLDTQIALVVNQLPTTGIKTNKIYLVRKNETGQDNAYVEYVYINNSWEKFGEYTPSIDLSEYSLKSQTVSQAAFVVNSGNTQLQLTNADNSKNTISVPLAERAGMSAGHLTLGQNGFMSASDKTKLDGIDVSANNYVLKKATSSDLGGIKIGFTGNSSSKNYPVTLDLNDKAYVHVPWTDTQTDISNCVKTDESSTINADVTVNGKISSTDADIVIDSGILILHEGSNGINFTGGDDSTYIAASGGKSNEYFAADGSIQTIPNSYLPLSGGTVTGGITVNGAINTKSNITTDGTVTAKGFVSKTEKNRHEVWACNGGSINLKTIIAATAVYVHGSIVESIAGSINLVTTIEDPDAIIFNKATGSFVAKKNNGYYMYWSVTDNLRISDPDKYGFFTANRGTVPYHKQLYMFANDNANIYIANNTGSVSVLDIYIN